MICFPQNMSGKFIFLSRQEASALRKDQDSDNLPIHDVSSNSPTASILSPFSKSQITIPVPGMQEMRSTSVEGIWQGLKIINNEIDTSLFKTEERIKKRRNDDYQTTKFAYNKEPIDIKSAREKIYIPAYKYFIDNVLPNTYIQNYLRTSLAGIDQVFHDVDGNGDISDTTKPLSHASVLTSILAEKKLQVRKTKEFILNSVDIDTYREYQSLIDKLTDSYEYGFLPPSPLHFTSNLHLLLNNEQSLREDEKNELFVDLSENYANTLGYTFTHPTTGTCFLDRTYFSKDWKFAKVRREVSTMLFIQENRETRN